jgi:hypothetical protein
LALLGAVASMAPACDGDDEGSNDGEAGAGGQAGHGTAGSTSTAGHAGTGGNTNVSGTGFGGDAAGAGGLAGAGGATDCGTVDAASGVVICGEIKYRARTGIGCFYSPPDQAAIGGGGGGGAASGGEGGVGSGCDPDKCTEKPRGYCEAEAPGASGAGPVTCHYGCLTDEDCVTDEICVCADPSYGGRCVHAFCKTDADCTNGNRCGSHTDCDQFSCNEDPQCAVY